jgi:hypothetical protein
LLRGGYKKRIERYEVEKVVKGCQGTMPEESSKVNKSCTPLEQKKVKVKKHPIEPKIKCTNCGEMKDRLYKSSDWICADCLISFSVYPTPMVKWAKKTS